MKKNQSQEQLIKSQERRIKHLMIRVLEGFETNFPDVDHTHDGSLFKAELRTIFNDVIRAQRDEIREYDVDYRPLKVDQDGVSLSRSYLETVQKIEFMELPSIRIICHPDKFTALEAIRNEFGAGIIYKEQDNLILEIVGIDSCVNNVIPILDKYCLHDFIRAKYKMWRSEVTQLYCKRS